MEKRNISISLEKAREWYEGGNITLKQLALEAYSEEELKEEIAYSDILDKLWRSGKLVTCQTSISGITTSSIEKIKVLSKLYNIAAYFNGDWVPTSGNTIKAILKDVDSNVTLPVLDMLCVDNYLSDKKVEEFPIIYELLQRFNYVLCNKAREKDNNNKPI